MRSALALLCASALLAACGAFTPDPAWVEIYDPGAAVPGYNLVLFKRRLPMLIDMNGNVVHRWPARASARVRLLPDGGLLAIGVDGAVRELDWNGWTTWEFRLPGEDFPHHDLIPLANGNRLVLAQDVVERLDYLLEVDQESNVVWEWRASEHLAPDLAPARAELGSRRPSRSLTHVNSIQELPPNRWFDQGDARFRPGNILISARNLNTVYVVDRLSGDVVWRYDEGLDRQHEASMIPPGFPGAGNVLLFNNGLENRFAYRRSEVVEIDPVAETEVWSYRSPDFFSSTGGTAQILDRGNVLITSSRGGRLFEVARDGRIVWQWTPPYPPMREHRYPYDYCPQLAKLNRSPARPIDGGGRHHVDRELYDFGMGVPTRQGRIAGEERRLLASASVCRVLTLPERPRLTVSCGFEARTSDAARARDGETPAVTASIRVRPERASERVLFEHNLRLDAAAAANGSIEEQAVDLSDYGNATVELCLAATGSGGGPPDAAFFWTTPTIRSAAVRDEGNEKGPVDDAQRALQEKHLKTMGYVD